MRCVLCVTDSDGTTLRKKVPLEESSHWRNARFLSFMCFVCFCNISCDDSWIPNALCSSVFFKSIPVSSGRYSYCPHFLDSEGFIFVALSTNRQQTEIAKQIIQNNVSRGEGKASGQDSGKEQKSKGPASYPCAHPESYPLPHP